MQLFSGIVVLSLGSSVAAASSTAAIDAGVAAYEAGDFAAARAALRPMADRGSAIAETLMGVMAAKGHGRPADPAVAASWWLRAANRGYPPAQLALAKALADGKGVAADPGKAWIWAQLAASAGNGTATEASALADRLAAAFDAETLVKLESDRAAWRPWPGN